MPGNDKENSEESLSPTSDKTMPIWDKMGEITPLLDEINESILDGKDISDRSEAAKQVLKKTYELIGCIEDVLKRELNIKDVGEPPKWQMDLIAKKPQLKMAFKVFEFIKANTVKHAESRTLAQRRRTGKYKHTIKSGEHKGKPYDYDYVLFIPDYDRMELKLGLGKRQIQRYLKAFSETEPKILVDFGKGGPRESKIYGAGYWGFYEDKSGVRKPKRQFFMKGSREVKECLLNISL
jgi:hypothetical protein